MENATNIKDNVILCDIKKMLGYDPENKDDFDNDIAIIIDSVFVVLNQIGVGPEEVFEISSDIYNKKWSDFFGELEIDAMVKTYVYTKTRLLFDPPTSSFVTEAIKQTIAEYESRLNDTYDIQKQPKVEEGNDEE